ncbi:choice-of-anchor I family protein [Malaciobacter sp. WC5094]
MKKNYMGISLVASAILASIIFVGCGSSSSSTTSTSNTGTLNLNPNLANIDYTCGKTSGTTNSSGEYKYNEGETCTFMIGGKELKATPSSKLTIAAIAEQNEGVSSEALSAYIIAKMSKKTGKDYDVNNLPDTFDLPDDIEGSSSNTLDFSSIDKLSEKLDDADIKEKIKKIKIDVSKKFANKVDVKFKEIETPTTDATKTTRQASSEVVINGKTQNISYKTIMATGDSNNGEVFGLSKDYMDEAITFSGGTVDDGSPYICNGTNSGVGSGLDYSSFLNKDGKLYMVSQFECQVGSMYMLELEQNKETGELSAKDNSMKFISQKDEFGGFVHCAGQKTLWESHLGSEEYEPDAKSVEQGADSVTGLTGNKYYDEVAKFWKGDAKKMSPYYYGWTPEVKITDEGEADYTKHYAMGRMSHELAYVMPDNKTVYLSDDGTNVGLFMFVADKAKDLSAGTLYAAKWNQTSQAGVGAGEADITWVNLGHATNSEIRAYLDKDSNIATNDAIKFSDIFDVVAGDKDAGTCPTDYKAVNTSAGFECLNLKDGMQKAASRLESRRYAAYMGATTEFRKEEGITFDKNSGKLYVAMSSVERGMEDNSSNDLGGNNDIKVEKNKCGAIYSLDVNTETAKDTTDNTIDSEYVVKNMNAILTGTQTTYDSGSIYANNTCDVNGISNPDNVTFLENSDILMIGEDTGKHENNVVWAYNVKTKELTRTFTTPLDAETTSPFWYNNLANGYGYLSVVTQHPMEDQEGATLAQKQSTIGYVGPFKNLDELKETPKLNSFEKLAVLKTSIEGGSEIVAFDSTTNRMFTTNGANNALDINTVSYNEDKKTMSLTSFKSVDLSTYGAGVNSVAVTNGKVAVAVEKVDSQDTSKQVKGSVVVFNTAGEHIETIEVGYLPDMVTFNEDGSKIIVANEGEPNSDYSYDPKGSVGIIDVANDYAYTDLTFDGIEIPSDVVLKDGVDASLDLEPEYITVSANKAYVTLQENNALAIVDIASKKIDSVVALGFKDHSKEENAIDIEEEGITMLKTYKSLYGMYQPDSIASYKIGSKTYLVTANEGDGREYGEYSNETKISKLSLDSSIADVYANENDLKVNNELGKNSSGNYEKLYTFGARSFSIWDEKGTLVFDSKNELSKLTAKFMPSLFNQDDGEKDGRSGNKGVEPEALTVGEVNDRTYAFIGLERQNAIVIYDITDAQNAKFVKFIKSNKNENISPEGMKFVEPKNSPTGSALLMVAYEVSGSTAIYEIK